MEGISNILKCG